MSTVSDVKSKWEAGNVKAALDRFKNKADEFSALYKKMRGMPMEQRTKLPPELQNRYGKVLGKAESVQASIAGVRDKFNSAIEWLKDVTGMDGSELSGVPVVVAGYIAGIVGVTWVLGNTLSEMRGVDREVDIALTGGTKPAANAASLAAMGKKFVWPAVIIAVLWMLPSLIEDN